MSITLLIADDHEVVRAGLQSMLSGTEITIVAEASDGNQVLPLALTHRPSIIMLDVRMPGTDGITCLGRLRAELPDQPVLMFSAYDNPTYVARSVALGATDYVLKGSSREQLIEAIRSAATGHSPSESGELGRIAGTMQKKKEASDDTVPLTNREMQVLRHVALGLSNKEIARSLTISIETVKEHVQNILRKIDVSDRTQAAVWAVRRGLV
jgi:DNA-binding NarL/FixJ family response regulator